MTGQRKRPETGKLLIGQRVMVRRSYNDARGRKPEDMYIPAVVVKVGRAWVELEGWARSDTSPLCWRMRLDTQDEGNRQYPQGSASFATLEQHEWDTAEREAFQSLRNYGIELNATSWWRGREIELAEIINTAVSERGDEE